MAKELAMVKLTGALVLAGLLALASTVSNAQSTSIGQARGVKPQAEGSVAGPLRPGSSVHESETVRTGSAGQTNLQFIDDSTLNVGPTSVIKLDKYVYDPNKKTGTIVIDATRGAFRFVTGSQNKGGEVKIKTPYGTLGVRG
jgi:hypothetical protein